MSKQPRISLGDLSDLVSRFGEELLSKSGKPEHAATVRELREALSSGEVRKAADLLRAIKHKLDPDAPPAFYVASRLENAARVRLLADALRGRGFGEQSYDWTGHGSVQTEGAHRIAEVAHAELEGIRRASLVVVLLPGGRGTHVELGAAISLDKLVVLWAENERSLGDDLARECAFYRHPNVIRLFCAFEDLPREVERLWREACGEKAAKR